MTKRIDETFIPKTMEESDDIPSNPNLDVTIGDVINARVGRRDAMRTISAVAALAAVPAVGGALAGKAQAATPASSLTFKELEHGYDETHHVAEGYDAGILIRWGDPVASDAPAFDQNNLTAAAQLTQFGYNNDFIGYFPLPRGSKNSEHGLLAINHEYTDRHLMWPGLGGDEAEAIAKQTKDQIDVEMAAHGHSVIEVIREGGVWKVVPNSPYNRRISALETEMVLSGPAAGHDRLKTSQDATGAKVIGTINNCAGGWTPWGTVLIAEENFHGYFSADPLPAAEERNYKRYGIGKGWYGWANFHDRFDLNKEPNEANRFGWMVEFDPYDPESTPVKRTALGRFKHEGATAVLNHDGRVVLYSGDDERFDYVYKFVSTNKVDMDNPANNKDILDDGTLYVAKFEADGALKWMPLVFGQGPLTAENDFHSQADVLIETRRASDLLGATPMDRPEDVEPNPVTGSIFMALTNNSKRKEDQIDAANPRAKNIDGHILEMVPPGGVGPAAQHEAETFTWNIFLLAGDPANADAGAKYNAGVSANGWLSCPDNVAFDAKGRLWIATDGAPGRGIADGIWGSDVSGDGRALTRHFFRTPKGAEMCGPCFTPDGSTLFVAVQHPGDEKDSTFDAPATRWPDFQDGMPPRPSVLFITKKGGGEIGA
jgi:secreted PhoX family phosphatase